MRDVAHHTQHRLRSMTELSASSQSRYGSQGAGKGRLSSTLHWLRGLTSGSLCLEDLDEPHTCDSVPGDTAAGKAPVQLDLYCAHPFSFHCTPKWPQILRHQLLFRGLAHI